MPEHKTAAWLREKADRNDSLTAGEMRSVADTQDNVANNTGNGYNWADYTGATTTRAYCRGDGVCNAGTGALDTTFNGQSAVPEPGSLMLLGSGLLAIKERVMAKLGPECERGID